MDAQERGKVVAAEFFEDPSSEANLAQMVENHTLFAEQTARDEGYNSGYIEGHIAGVKESRVKALEEAAQKADDHAPIVSGSPGPLFDAGWCSACGGISAAIRALKET